MKVIDEIWICTDCYQYFIGGDATFLDYHYKPDEAKKRIEQMEEGSKQFKGSFVDANDTNPFSKYPCELCGLELHGKRHLISILQQQ